MSNVPRLHWSADPNEPGMYEDPDGDYVPYEDYQASERLNATLVEALAGLADEYINRRCQFGHEYLWTKHEVTDAVNRAIRLIEKHRAESAEGESDE
jgi:hypothetical protein